MVFITTDPLDVLPEGLLRQCDVPFAAVGLNGGRDGVLPSGWVTVDPGDLVDAIDLRKRFVEFLEAWPRVAVAGDQSFNDLFTVGGKYSIWWTSVAAERQITHGMFKYFRYAALVDRIIDRWSPKTILLFTRDPVCATLVRSRAQESDIIVRLLPGCAKPLDRQTSVTGTWLGQSFWYALASPARRLAFALQCRWSLRAADLFRHSARPTVIFSSVWPRHLHMRDGQLSLLYWDEVSKALEAIEPSAAHAFLPRKLDEIADEATSVGGLDAVRHAKAPLLIWERFFPLRGCLSTIGRQLVTLCRFYLLSRRSEFQRSFRFANTNMADAVLPGLMHGIQRAIDWSFKTSQVALAIRAAGNVKAMVVSEEMYRHSMPPLAAAAKLSIPTVGIQHGNIMPTHLVYAVPRGHVEHAPVPDYFGAYGEYAKEVLSVQGAFPADRVWITGAARLDPLVNRLPDQSAARAALGLPPDKRVVVLATQTFPWFATALRAVLECMRDCPDSVLCVKKHSSIRAMPLAEIEALATQIGVPNMRGFDAHTDLLLAACSVWISASSTTLLEATLIGRPTICVNFSGYPDRYPYVEEGVSLPARSVDELTRSLSCVLAPSTDSARERRRDAFLRRHVGPTTDGLGAVTFARRVGELIAG